MGCRAADAIPLQQSQVSAFWLPPSKAMALMSFRCVTAMPMPSGRQDARPPPHATPGQKIPPKPRDTPMMALRFDMDALRLVVIYDKSLTPILADHFPRMSNANGF